jgi:hypothetical protein
LFLRANSRTLNWALTDIKAMTRLAKSSGLSQTKCALTLAIFVLSFCLTGCLHPRIGPQSIPRDRIDYSGTLADSWKQETLLNIVKVRYLDPPVFIDVGNIVSSYSLAQSAGAAITIVPQGSNGNLSGSVGVTTSPTITYTPLTGSDYVKGLVTPLPAESLFAAMQNGLPADSVLFTSFVSINGLRNQRVSVAGVAPADPGFHRVRELLRDIQASGAVRLYIKKVTPKAKEKSKDKDKDKKKDDDDDDDDDKKPPEQENRVIAFPTKNISSETLAQIKELRELLHLNPNATEFVLTNAPVQSSDNEIAVQTRSIIEMMKNMAEEVEVPPEDVAQHRALPGFQTGEAVPGVLSIMRIRSSKQKPTDAFISVHYRNSWFRIDDDDLASKAVFAQLMELFTMIDTNNKQPLPVVTIPIP